MTVDSDVSLHDKPEYKADVSRYTQIVLD